MSTVTSRTSPSSLAACLPEPEVSSGATGAPTATPVKAGAVPSSRTGVEEYRENDVNQGLAGRALERTYEQALGVLPRGGKLELSTQGLLRLEVAAEVKAKVEVERFQDGSYQVTLRGGAGVGLAGSTGKGASGSAMLGAQGAVTLRFANAAEAADRLAALVQEGALGAAKLSGAVGYVAAKGAELTGLVDSDAPARAARVMKNVQSFEVGLYAELKGELELTAAKVGGAVVGESTLRADVVNGKLVYESSLQVQLQGESEGHLLDAAAGLEGRLILRAEVALTKEELALLREGKLEPRSLMKPERIRKSATQEVRGELSVLANGEGVLARGAGASYTAKREVPLESLGELTRLVDLQGEWEVSAMRKTSGGLNDEWELEAGVAELKVGVSMETPLFRGRMTLGEVGAAAREAGARQASDEQLLLARRMAALR